MVAVLFVVFAALLSTVSSRECYQCQSYTSWNVCDLVRTTAQCAESRCVTVRARSGTDDFYLRGCGRLCDASVAPQCSHPGVTCKAECCYSDLCNTKLLSLSEDSNPQPGLQSPPIGETSRECYQCASTRSGADCDASRIKVQCATSKQCVTATYKSSTDVGYLRACANVCDAASVPACNEPDTTCKVACCSTDRCNSQDFNAVGRSQAKQASSARGSAPKHLLCFFYITAAILASKFVFF